MKKPLLFLLMGFLTLATSIRAQKTIKLKESMTLQMPRSADSDMPGTRGASVAWHPVQKKYYAAMAGNAGFPFAIFNATGKLLSSESLNCDEDTRGLWYNPVKKQIQGNAYSDGGWFVHKLNANGMKTATEVFLEGMNQPNGQCVGAYNPLTKQVLFLDEGEVAKYDASTGQLVGTINIQWAKAKTDDEEDEDDYDLEETDPEETYNYTTMICTGIKGKELGFLNIVNKEIELYNSETGALAAKLALPENSIVEPSFNFSYANGMYWLFDMKARTWTAYK